MAKTKQQPNIEKISLYSPHDKQKEIHSACMPTNKTFFVTVVAGRRGGKSMAAQNQVLFWALKDIGCTIWYVSPTDSQSHNVINDIIKAIKDTPIVKKINNSKMN